MTINLVASVNRTLVSHNSRSQKSEICTTGPKSRYQQTHTPCRGSRGRTFPLFSSFWWLLHALATGHITPVFESLSAPCSLGFLLCRQVKNIPPPPPKVTIAPTVRMCSCHPRWLPHPEILNYSFTIYGNVHRFQGLEHAHHLGSQFLTHRTVPPAIPPESQS